MPDALETEFSHSLAHLAGYDGHQDVEWAAKEGWTTTWSWGAEGWDLGQPPYVTYATRTLPDGRVQVRSYCEGDLTIKTFATAAEAHAELDEAFLFYARSAWWWDEEAYLADPARFQGPFSWSRVDR